MTPPREIPGIPRVRKRVFRSYVRDSVSLVGIYLFATGFFLYSIAFLKGAQVLMFVPALFVGILAYSFFETRRFAKAARFSLEGGGNSFVIRPLVPPDSLYAFRVSFREVDGKAVFLNPDSQGRLKCPDAEGELEVHFRTSFDVFRRIVPLGRIRKADPGAGVSESESRGAFFAFEKYEGGLVMGKMDALRSSGSAVPVLRVDSDSGRTERERSGPPVLEVRSDLPLAVSDFPKESKFDRAILLLLCSLVVAIQWESARYLAVLVTTFVLAYAARRFFVRELGKGLRTFVVFLFFLATFAQAWTDSDVTGPVSVFLLQILLLHSFFPSSRDESFLFIFLTLFVFATVSFLSVQVWFVAFFVALLYFVVKLLF